MAAYKLVSKTREEWLENRKGGIGASEVATILGCNPWDTPYQLWLRKTGQAAPIEENLSMRLGHLLEESVATLWGEETNREVIKSTAGDWMYVDKDKPFLRVSPDREWWIPGMKKNARNRGILECKTTQKSIDADAIPKHWFCQVQMNLGVAGYEHASLAWLTSGRNFGFKDIEFNKSFYEWMVSEVETFWNENVLKGIAPAPVNLQDIISIYPKSEDGKGIEVSEEIALMCEELKTLNEQLDKMEEGKKAIEEKIKMAFGDAESISYGGTTLATWKSSKPSEKFDSKRFKAEHPELAAQYIKEQAGSRRFNLK